MNFGAVLRLFRIDAGASLRELASAVGVSSAYLSRVENGHDPAPTPDRLVAIARVLGIPAALLIEFAERVEPAVASYLSEVPAASRLFLEVARRRLTAAQIARVLAFVEAEFPDGTERAVASPTLHALCSPERVLVGVHASALEDVIDLAASRLAPAFPGVSPAELAAAIRAREQAGSTALGGGLVLPHTSSPSTTPAAALITLAPPLGDGPDGRPVRVAIVLAGLGQGNLPLLARASALARHDALDAIADATTPEAAVDALRSAERWLVAHADGWGTPRHRASGVGPA